MRGKAAIISCSHFPIQGHKEYKSAYVKNGLASRQFHIKVRINEMTFTPLIAQLISAELKINDFVVEEG